MAASTTTGFHKLTNVEAQRIMAILEETCGKLDLLSHVPPLELPDEDQLRDELGPDVLQVRAPLLAATVLEHRRLSTPLSALVRR
jgi:hypothetical protein